jgi:hypothetical protein
LCHRRPWRQTWLWAPCSWERAVQRAWLQETQR